MTTIVEENDGCVIYRDSGSPIIIDTPFYKDTTHYKEWMGSAISPSDGMLAEGVDLIHLFVNGIEQTYSKANLLREAARMIYNYGAGMARADGYKPFDQSTSGQKGMARMIDVIIMIILQIKDRNAIIRIPYLMDFDYSHTLDEYPNCYVVHDFDFGNYYDSIRHSLPNGWKYNTALTYSFLFSQYFQNS